MSILMAPAVNVDCGIGVRGVLLSMDIVSGRVVPQAVISIKARQIVKYFCIVVVFFSIFYL